MDSLSFISDICGALKKLKRTGWVKHQVPFPESDSDHMHRCAMCALLLYQPPHPQDDYSSSTFNQKFHPDNVNKEKLLRMAVTHDVCESLAGDITPYCNNVDSKYAKEEQAMKDIQKIVGDPLGQELYNLWKEYENQTTVEAIYCKDIDKFEMVVQAFEYEKEHLLQNNKKNNNDDNNVNNNNNNNNDVNDNNNDNCTSNKKPKLEQQQEETNNNDTKKQERKSVMEEPMRGFFISTNSCIKTPLFRRLDAELRQRRKVMLQEKNWTVTLQEEQQPLPKVTTTENSK